MSERELVITPGGSAELRGTDGNVEWASADDESFREEFTDDMLEEEDVDDILEYLIEEDYLTDEQADAIEVVIETLDGDH